jgi:hypothetical protein
VLVLIEVAAGRGAPGSASRSKPMSTARSVRSSSQSNSSSTLHRWLAVRRGAPHSPSQTEAGISVDSSPADVAWTPALNRVASQPGPFGCDWSNRIRRVASKRTPR